MFDLVSGHYPGFLFGLPIGSYLPVFHFHETTPQALEPAFAYLAENGYRTVTSDAVARLVRDGRRPEPRTVMLAFDDALASLWLVVAPLLRRYSLTAVTYAIPGRIADAAAVRPTLDTGPVDPLADHAVNPFVTWPELEALVASGLVDVQSHTWSHSMVFAGAHVVDAVGPGFLDDHFLNRPRLDAAGPLEFLTPERTGYPLFRRRSRMSDALRFFPAPQSVDEFLTWIGQEGGARLFDQPDWRERLRTRWSEPVKGRWETGDEQRSAIRDELIKGREVLETRLGVRVHHICLPWGITGRVTRELLAELGFVTAFANRLRGRMAVSSHDDPYFLKRLHSRFVFALPGSGRRIFALGGR